MMNSISMIKSVIDNLMDKQIMINIKTINSDLEKINIKWKEFN